MIRRRGEVRCEVKSEEYEEYGRKMEARRGALLDSEGRFVMWY